MFIRCVGDFDAVNAANEGLFVLGGFDVVGPLVVYRAGEEAAGAAGGVEHGLGELGVDTVDDELGDGARGVKLTRVAGALQVLEDLLVDVAEGVAVFGVVEVDLADLVDDLADQGAGLHVVVGILEDVADDLGAGAIRPFEDELFLEGGKELVVDELAEVVARHALGVGGPVAPAQLLGKRRGVGVFEEFDLGLAVVVDFQEEHPDELADALRVAVDADVLSHDVLNGLNGAADVAHFLKYFKRKRGGRFIFSCRSRPAFPALGYRPKCPSRIGARGSC